MAEPATISIAAIQLLRALVSELERTNGLTAPVASQARISPRPRAAAGATLTDPDLPDPDPCSCDQAIELQRIVRHVHSLAVEMVRVTETTPG